MLNHSFPASDFGGQDDNGNLLNDGADTYTYDTANRLKTVTNPQAVNAYQYNGQGDRLSQTVNGVTTQYTLDLNAELTQVLSDGANTYLYGTGRIGEQQPGGIAYHLPDALGSVRQIADGSAGVTLAQSYNPFGSVMATAGGGGSIFGYVGEANDATGLIFLRARYYSPTLGRFFTRDPWAGNAQAPGTLHPYLYGLNNPLRYKDPSGRACQDYDMAGHIITVCNNKPEWDTIVYGAQSVSSYPQQYVQGKPSVDSTSTSNAAPSQSNRPKSTETPRLYQPTLTPGPQVCSNFAPGTDPECSPMNWGSDSADLMLKAMGVEFDLAENALGVKIPLISIVPDVLSQVHKDEDKGYSSVQMAFRAAVAASEGQITSITSAVAGTSAFIATVDNPFFAIGAYISVSVSMSELFDKVNEGSIFPYLKKLENNQH